MHDILQGMQDPHEGWPRSCRDSQRSVARRTPCGQRPQGNASGGLASAGDLAKIKERKGKAEHRERI